MEGLNSLMKLIIIPQLLWPGIFKTQCDYLLIYGF
jgi:hypothetical protein